MSFQLTQMFTGPRPSQTNLGTLPAPSPSPPLHEAHVPDPEPYAGNLVRCKPFLLQCSVVFGQHPLTYATEEAKVAYIMGLPRGDALA